MTMIAPISLCQFCANSAPKRTEYTDRPSMDRIVQNVVWLSFVRFRSESRGLWKTLSAVYETAALPTELRWQIRTQEAGIREQHFYQNLLPIQRYIILPISLMSIILTQRVYRRNEETERRRSGDMSSLRAFIVVLRLLRPPSTMMRGGWRTRSDNVCAWCVQPIA